MKPQTFFADVQTGDEARRKIKEQLFLILEGKIPSFPLSETNEFGQLEQLQHGFAFKAFPDDKFLLKLVVERNDGLPVVEEEGKLGIRCIARMQGEFGAIFRNKAGLLAAAISLISDSEQLAGYYLKSICPPGINEETWLHLFSLPMFERIAIAASMMAAEINRLYHAETLRNG